MAYFWCTDHQAVEDESGCRAEVRLGPFPTRESAQHALQTVAEREQKYDAEDRAWRDGE